MEQRKVYASMESLYRNYDDDSCYSIYYAHRYDNVIKVLDDEDIRRNRFTDV